MDHTLKTGCFGLLFFYYKKTFRLPVEGAKLKNPGDFYFEAI
jgi:hypothetical protein